MGAMSRHCYENTSWGRVSKLKLAVPAGLPDRWTHLVLSHPSPRLPRFARNDIEELCSRGMPSMSLRGAGATWQSLGGVAKELRGPSGQHYVGAGWKHPFSYIVVSPTRDMMNLERAPVLCHSEGAKSPEVVRVDPVDRLC